MIVSMINEDSTSAMFAEARKVIHKISTFLRLETSHNAFQHLCKTSQFELIFLAVITRLGLIPATISFFSFTKLINLYSSDSTQPSRLVLKKNNKIKIAGRMDLPDLTQPNSRANMHHFFLLISR
jgi:hypothetical protein